VLTVKLTAGGPSFCRFDRQGGVITRPAPFTETVVGEKTQGCEGVVGFDPESSPEEPSKGGLEAALKNSVPQNWWAGKFCQASKHIPKNIFAHAMPGVVRGRY